MRSNYMGGGMPQNPMGQMMQAFQQFSQNPAGFLQQMGIQVPHGMNNPTQLWDWMQKSGNINPQQLQQVQQAQQSAANSPIFMQAFGKK